LLGAGGALGCAGFDSLEWPERGRLGCLMAGRKFPRVDEAVIPGTRIHAGNRLATRRNYRRFDFARVDLAFALAAFTRTRTARTFARVDFARAPVDFARRVRWRTRCAGSCAIPALTATAPSAEPIDLATSVSTPAVSFAVSFTLRPTVFAVIAILLGIWFVFSSSLRTRLLASRCCE